MKKISILLLPFLCLTALLSTGIAFSTQASETGLQPVRIHGTITKGENNRLQMTRQDGEAAGQVMVLTLSDETKILDAVTGFPMALDQLKNGEMIYAYISPAVTLSLPPIANAQLLLCNIPADFKVPDYITIDTLTVDGSGNSGSIKTTDDTIYTVSQDCQILPYLTRNIVRLSDLTKGRTCLIWSKNASNEAYKIVAFSHSLSQTGWKQMDGKWYYYDQNSEIHKGWLKDGEDWYYMNPETGIMLTGFLTIDGKTYYLQDNGKMITSARTFTPDKSGALH